MFQPEEVVRDKYGFWFHSALNKSEEEDITKVAGAEDMEFKFVGFRVGCVGRAPAKIRRR